MSKAAVKWQINTVLSFDAYSFKTKGVEFSGNFKHENEKPLLIRQ